MVEIHKDAQFNGFNGELYSNIIVNNNVTKHTV